MTDTKTVREALDVLSRRMSGRLPDITDEGILRLHRESLAALDRIEAVETVTVEDIAMCIQDWKFNEENQQPFFGDYLAVKFPNGLRITKEK